MSGHSPSRRLRAKTSEFTEFFRGAGQGPSEARQTPSVNLEVPSSDTEASSKKKITRIQLFGRSRKKSNQSTASSPFVSSRESSEFGEVSNRAASSDRRPSVEPPLPTKMPLNSIGSKLAATFSHSRLPKLSPNIQTETAPVTRPSTLSPSTSRAASYESGSSNGSRTRSTTPRPAQPVITVSLSPDNLSQYKNLFTRPPDSNVTPSPSSPSNHRLPKSESPIYLRRGQTPASAIAAAHRQATSTGDDRPPSRSSRYSRKNSDSDKGHEETPGSPVTQESPRLETPDGGEKGLPASLQRHPSSATGSVQSPENSNSATRSRMKPPTTLARSKPPSMPLPQTPVSSPPPPEMPSSPLRQTFKAELEPTTALKTLARPRAHTIGSVGNSSLPATLSRPTIKHMATLHPPSTDIPEANFDIETASAAKLRESLKVRNQQYDDLATYVLKLTEAHVAEVANLEKKVITLDKEVSRKDKELKGLRWIINNGDSSQPKPLPPGVLNHALLSSTFSESYQDTSRIMPGTSRRLNYQSDSGTESHAESMRSAASGSESISSIRNRSLRKPANLAEVTYNFCRTASTRRSSKLPPGLGVEKMIPEMPTTIKRSSLGSVSPSPSSSTSSLLPPSPSITMSSLSAIPEGPSSLRYDNSDQEERRALRASHRISTSSMTSSSTAASSSAYSANMKRSRPPSIAQVLEKSPIMDDVLEKLRPFA